MNTNIKTGCVGQFMHNITVNIPGNFGEWYLISWYECKTMLLKK